MKKFLNKLNGSGKFDADALREEEHLGDDNEHQDLHYRKSSTLPADPRDNPEDIKPARKGSLKSKVISPRSKASAMDFEDNKRSSKEIKDKENKDKDKLNESDDKVFRKSFSLKTVSLFKSTDQVKNPDSPAVKSPSLKGIFSSYEQQKDGPLVDFEGSDEEMDDDAAVPHNRARDDEELLYSSAPIRVPSAPARIATSPMLTSSPSSNSKGSKSPTSSSPVRTASPRIINSPSGSPTNQHSTSPRVVPTFSPTPTAPPAQAIKPSPMVLVADDFDAHFGGRVRTESITDDYGAPFKADFERGRSDSVSEDVDLDNELMQDKPKSGLFSSFGANKPKKLK